MRGLTTLSCCRRSQTDYLSTDHCIDDDAGSDVDVFEETMAEVDTDAKKQLNGELKDKVDEDEDEAGPVASDTKDADEDEPEVRGKGEAEDEVDDDEGPEASEFNVESIQKHKIVKGDLLYFIKWQGWDESDNTWEPEEHLLPYVVWSLSPPSELTITVAVTPNKF